MLIATFAAGLTMALLLPRYDRWNTRGTEALQASRANCRGAVRERRRNRRGRARSAVNRRRTLTENSRLLRAAAFDRGFGQLTGWPGRLIETPEVARLWLRGNQGDALSEEDAARDAELATDHYMARFASYSRHAAAGNHTLAEDQLGLIAELCTAHPGFRRWFEPLKAPMRGPIAFRESALEFLDSLEAHRHLGVDDWVDRELGVGCAARERTRGPNRPVRILGHHVEQHAAVDEH